MQEQPQLVFDFKGGVPVASTPRAIDPDDARPERLLVAAADRGVPTRIVIHSYEVPLLIRVVLGLAVFPFTGTYGVRALSLEMLDSDLTHEDELEEYFKDSGRTAIKIQAFHQSVTSAGVMHAKLGVIDDQHALCIGSPFGQSYVDPPDHAIDAPVRGASTGLPKHDAGFAVTGPATADIHRNIQLLWNTENSADPIADLPRTPAAQTSGGDGVCSLQLVRTLTAGRFPGQDEGEKGILEGYLRAIASAEDFIYIETQYFTDDPIGHALAEAMKQKRNRPGKRDLQVIVLLNIQPDVPFYPFKQRRLITRIRKAIGQTPGGPQQFGVFTRWTHELFGTRPFMLPIYVHAKLAVVDDEWASVGSANLDGLSLVGDYANRVFGSVLNAELFREQRAVEINANLFNGVAGQPASGIVSRLRRRLFAEHLNFPGSSPAVPDENHQDLQSPPAKGWLDLWSTRAEAARLQLKTSPQSSMAQMARVLPWPDKDTTYKMPREHLEALGLAKGSVVPLKSTRAFDFKKGEWKEGVLEMDF